MYTLEGVSSVEESLMKSLNDIKGNLSDFYCRRGYACNGLYVMFVSTILVYFLLIFISVVFSEYEYPRHERQFTPIA